VQEAVTDVRGNTQTNFKHEVPKKSGINQPRINLMSPRIEHK